MGIRMGEIVTNLTLLPTHEVLLLCVVENDVICRNWGDAYETLETGVFGVAVLRATFVCVYQHDNNDVF